MRAKNSVYRKKETKMFLVISPTKLGRFWWNLVHCPRAAASLSRSLLLSRNERNWATVPSGSHHADCWPAQWRLHNHVSPRQPSVEGTQPCITDADNAAVQLIECTSLRDYDRSNSKCQKTEFEFINQTSNFRTSFNNPSSLSAYQCWWRHRKQIASFYTASTTGSQTDLKPTVETVNN